METRVLIRHETRGINTGKGGQYEGVAKIEMTGLEETENNLQWEQSCSSPEFNLDKLLEEISMDDKDKKKDKMNESKLETKSLECLEIKWSFLSHNPLRIVLCAMNIGGMWHQMVMA